MGYQGLNLRRANRRDMQRGHAEDQKAFCVVMGYLYHKAGQGGQCMFHDKMQA